MSPRILMALNTPAVSAPPPAPRAFEDRAGKMHPQLCFSICQQLALIFCVYACKCAIIWAR